MKQKKIFEVIIPKELSKHEKFRAAKSLQRDSLAIFVDTVSMYSDRRTAGGQYQQITNEMFRKRVPKGRIKQCREQLVSMGIIECDGTFCFRDFSNLKALGYRLSGHIQSSGFVVYRLESELASDRFEKLNQIGVESKQIVVGKIDSLHKQLIGKLSQISIDRDACLEIVQKLPLGLQSNARCQIEKIHGQNLFYSVAESGRCYTSIANLRKVFRRHLFVKLNGKRHGMVVLDFSCFQPLLLGLLTRQHDRTADLRLYLKLTQSGQFYDMVAADLGLTRDDVKLAALTYICGPWYETKPLARERTKAENDILWELCSWMNTNCPAVANYLKAEKQDKKNYKTTNTRKRRAENKPTSPYVIVSHKLQQLESEIVVRECCSQVLKRFPEFPIATIHDAILVPEKISKEVREIMEESMRKRGVKVRVKMEEVRGRAIRSPELKKSSVLVSC